MADVTRAKAPDLDEDGFYAPGSWTREQLVAFANEIDSLAPDGRETAVDLGIVRAVKVLRDGGVETFESCEGGDGHSMAGPTVRFIGDVEAGWKALAVCLTYAFPVCALRRDWTISVNGEPHEHNGRSSSAARSRRHPRSGHSLRGLPIGFVPMPAMALPSRFTR